MKVKFNRIVAVLIALLIVAGLTTLYVWQARLPKKEVINEQLRYTWRQSYFSKYADLKEVFKDHKELSKLIERSRLNFADRYAISTLFQRELSEASDNGNFQIVGLVMQRTFNYRVDADRIKDFFSKAEKKYGISIISRVRHTDTHAYAVFGFSLGHDDVSGGKSPLLSIENEFISLVGLKTEARYDASVDYQASSIVSAGSVTAKPIQSVAEVTLSGKLMELEAALDRDEDSINKLIFSENSPYIKTESIQEKPIYLLVIVGAVFSTALLITLFILYRLISSFCRKRSKTKSEAL